MSQAKSRARQASSRAQSALRKFQQDIRGAERKLKQAVDSHKRTVGSHTARVRVHQARLKQALTQLQRSTRQPRVTVRALHTAFVRLEERQDSQSALDSEFLSLAEREAANSVELESALHREPRLDDEEASADLEESSISEELSRLSPSLAVTWRGALFSLSPRNPEASRHFCTSSRQILSDVLDLTAPEEAARRALPDCELTPNGTATRRARLHYLLARRGATTPEMADFLDADIEDAVSLFGSLNAGTHGDVGRYGITQLRQLKRRAEDAISFILRVVGGGSGPGPW